ncbi:undecaprenyl-phosphate 4-deoxy-4-formamido-L-arabinose transferase, partial [Aeromonas hydrophila]
YGLMHLINLMYDLVTCMTTTPLRLLSIVGSVVAGIGFTFSILLILMRLILGADWAADGVFTLFAILFTFVGVQLLGMGLLGEYIGRMYTDVRARPRYFIHQIVRSAITPSQQEAEQ